MSLHTELDALDAAVTDTHALVDRQDRAISTLQQQNTDLAARNDELARELAGCRNPVTPTLFGINYANKSELGTTQPKVVRIFNGSANLTQATIDQLKWCQANEVRPILSLVTYPNPLTPAVAAQVKALCAEGDITVNHESANPSKNRVAATVKKAATDSAAVVAAHMPGWVYGDIFMAWDVNSGDPARHPNLWRADTGRWIGFDTYDSKTMSDLSKFDSFSYLINKPLAYARSLGIDVLIPEVACRPDRLGGVGFRDNWIGGLEAVVSSASDIKRVVWFASEVGCPSQFLPEGWHLTTGGGQASWKALVG